MRHYEFSNISFEGGIHRLANEVISNSGNCLSQFICIIFCFAGLGMGLFMIGAKLIQNIIG